MTNIRYDLDISRRKPRGQSSTGTWRQRWSPATTVSRRRTLKILKRRRRKEMKSGSDIFPLTFQIVMIVN